MHRFCSRLRLGQAQQHVALSAIRIVASMHRGWLATGKLKTREDIAEGLENFPETLLRLFKGENTGKLALKVAD